MTGNAAIAEGVLLARVETIAAYPITPQTGIVDRLSFLINEGRSTADMVHTESEFSAISVVIGSTIGGLRSFTATSSQGLLMMTEATYYAAGMRLPLVMGVVNRGLSAPVTIFSDHQDSMSLRDNGWLQFYCKDAQEALDTIIIAYKIAEDKKVLLPVMVCIDGFTISHFSQSVTVPTQAQIDDFLPVFSPEFPHMDRNDPKFLGTAVWPDYYEEFIYLRNSAINESKKVIQKAISSYSEQIRHTSQIIERYKTEEASILVIGIGSMMSTLESYLDQNSSKENRSDLGLIRIKSFRPFPSEELVEQIKGRSQIIVLDRAISPSQAGPIFLEISSLIQTFQLDVKCYGLILGLGGRDIQPEMVDVVLKVVKDIKSDSLSSRQIWVDLNQGTIQRWKKNE